MSDPLLTDGVPTLGVESDVDRDAKIEQLLLVGLDHYFAAQHEHAITVWTRVLFIDRGHARARAYIERARSALAERQRASEELLQNGVEALGRGEGEEARRLLQAAIDGGAPEADALPVLGRLTRLEAAAAPVPVHPVTRVDRRASEPRVRGRRRGAMAGLSTLAVLALAAMATLVVLPPARLEWRPWLALMGEEVPAGAAPVTKEVVLPLPRRGEISLTRARSLAAGGHLRDALAALDDVRATDAQKADADRLRAEIQRQLLALVEPPASTPAAPEKGERRD